MTTTPAQHERNRKTSGRVPSRLTRADLDALEVADIDVSPTALGDMARDDAAGVATLTLDGVVIDVLSLDYATTFPSF